MSGNPLDQLRELLDPGACHVTNLPDRIWVFGGAFRSARQDPASSQRDSFWVQSLERIPPSASNWIAKLDRPEDHEGWWAFSGYGDLLEFERDAAYLSRAVLLFAESAGSLAELGALSIDPALVGRLIVVVQENYLKPGARESFLTLGPLRRAEALSQRCVVGEGKELSAPDFESIIELITEWLPTAHKKERLRPEDPTHRLLLLADLVDLLIVSKTQDLISVAAHFGVSLATQDVEKALNLLGFLDLVRIVFRGKERFYLRKEGSGAPWMDYTARESTFDRSRFKLLCNEAIQQDVRRRSILESSK